VDDNQEFDAEVFVAWPGSHADLATLVAGVLQGTADDDEVTAGPFTFQVELNEEADDARAAQWPDGFLFFSAMLVGYVSPPTPVPERAAVITRLLLALWDSGTPAVAASDYEDLLPGGAGNGDRSLPWPSPAAVE